MKNMKERQKFCFALIGLFVGIALFPSSSSIHAEEIGAGVWSRIRATIAQSSAPSTFFFATPHGDSITRTIEIGNTLKNNRRSFHTVIIIGAGGGDVKLKVAGNKDDEVLFASMGIAVVTDEEGAPIISHDFGYAERDGDYTLTFSTESIAAAIVVIAPLYSVGYWSVPITLEMTVSME